MSDEPELERLRRQGAEDRKLLRKAADALAEIDRTGGLDAVHADVLASLRIRLEGKKRASLEDLLTAAGDIGGRKELGDVPARDDESQEWPAIKEKKKEWPGS